MKSFRWLLCFVVMALSTVALAQSDAQKSFDELKTLAGKWEGPVKVVPPMPEMNSNKPTQVTMRVTSRGNALVHEMLEAGAVDDPIKIDHPVTMLYMDEGRLLLTHYCDAGNRPRMVAKASPDGKTVEFEFLDIAGNPQYHMHHSVFTIIDATHHSEDWTFMVGDKPVVAHFELQRAD